MGEGTKIDYATDTFNGWIGCTEVDGNPQCSRCYAREMAKFRDWAKWGDEYPRMLTSEAYWRQPFQWDRKAAAIGLHRRVFAFSLGDVFDEYGPAWPEDRPFPRPHGIGKRDHLDATHAIWAMPNPRSLDVFMHAIVKQTPHLTWMLFSKRYELAAGYLRQLWSRNPWPNVWMIFSAGTQRNLNEAKAAHRKFTAAVQGISCEPSFEELDFGAFGPVNWVIGGTESGRGARHTEKLDWFRSTAEQCKAWQVPFFMKQITDKRGQKLPLARWPEDLNIRELPTARTFEYDPYGA